jgi:hypothetical protein
LELSKLGVESATAPFAKKKNENTVATILTIIALSHAQYQLISSFTAMLR